MVDGDGAGDPARRHCACVSYTTWLSPWGGHETAPWHYLGGDYAARRYAPAARQRSRRTGTATRCSRCPPPGCCAGRAPVRTLDLVAVLPRYHPRWAHWLVRVPAAARGRPVEPAAGPAPAMTTTTAPAEPTVPDEPTTSDGPPDPPDSRSVPLAWRLAWPRSASGWCCSRSPRTPAVIARTPSSTWSSTRLGFLGRALHLWDPLGAFGQLQNQAYGYLFPMGPFFLLGDWLALPPWVIQRLWCRAAVVGFLGVVRLGRPLRLGSPGPALVAGSPTRWRRGCSRARVDLGPRCCRWQWRPGCCCRWSVGPPDRLSPRRAAALSGVSRCCSPAGSTPRPRSPILPLAGAVAAHPASRTAPPAPGRLVGGARSRRPAPGGSLPLLLLGRYSPPFLDYIESASVTTAVTDLLDVLRGTSHWVARVSGAGGPGWPAGFVLTTSRPRSSPPALVAVLGLAGLCSPRPAGPPLPRRRAAARRRAGRRRARRPGRRAAGSGRSASCWTARSRRCATCTSSTRCCGCRWSWASPTC